MRTATSVGSRTPKQPAHAGVPDRRLCAALGCSRPASGIRSPRSGVVTSSCKACQARPQGRASAEGPWLACRNPGPRGRVRYSARWPNVLGRSAVAIRRGSRMSPHRRIDSEIGTAGNGCRWGVTYAVEWRPVAHDGPPCATQVPCRPEICRPADYSRSRSRSMPPRRALCRSCVSHDRDPSDRGDSLDSSGLRARPAPVARSHCRPRLAGR